MCLLVVELGQCVLEDADQFVEVFLVASPEQADGGINPLVVVAAEDFRDLALNGLLEGEEEATNLAGREFDEAVAAQDPARVGYGLGRKQGQGGSEPESFSEQDRILGR
jgi:hypothetical protein